MTSEIIKTETTYQWIYGLCDNALTPAVLISISVAITISIVFSFFRRKCKRECCKK